MAQHSKQKKNNHQNKMISALLLVIFLAAVLAIILFSCSSGSDATDADSSDDASIVEESSGSDESSSDEEDSSDEASSSDEEDSSDEGDSSDEETSSESEESSEDASSEEASSEEEESSGSSSDEESDDDDWMLILVNYENAVPDDYEVTLIELSNGISVDERIYPYLQEMFDDMRALGLYPQVVEGYRTYEYQEELLNNRIASYVEQGYSEEEAEELALDYVSLPGYSEHQTGLAVDINPDYDYSTADEVYGWLKENAHLYGFILRYPEDKVEITGISYEYWHFRYVGEDAAAYIYENNLCLEEYLEEISTEGSAEE